MRWLYVVIAGLFEIGWIFSLKFSDGFSRLFPMVFYAICGLGAAFCLSQALKTLPVGTTYAVWVGIAAAGSNILSMVFLDEPYRFSRVGYIALIVIGVVGLKISSPQ